MSLSFSLFSLSSMMEFTQYSRYSNYRNPPRSNYPETQRGALTAAVPSPPYGPSQREGEYRSYNQQQEQPTETSLKSAPPPPPPQQQQQPPSPRKSMFEFISPFDHLSSSSSIKKKPVPQPPSISSGNEDSGSWSNITDPKRQSVDNLLEHLTRGTAPPPPPPQAPPAYESYLSGSDFSQGEQQQPSRAPPPPLPPKPVPNRTTSPRSPPKTHQRPQVRPAESPAGQVASAPLPLTVAPSRRDKESSPGPRGGYRKNPAGQAKFNNKSQSSPRQIYLYPCDIQGAEILFFSPQPQSIVFDVSQSLDEIQAPRDSVKSTAIALVKQDSVFLPGTTIGATHWVAYAMTRGKLLYFFQQISSMLTHILH